MSQPSDETSTPAAPPEAPRRSPLRGILEIVETLVLTLVIFFIIQNFVAQPFQVQQFSMQHTFEQGDYVLVDKLSPRWAPYQRGNVVVFAPPEGWGPNRTPFIKRVIGVAGDTVSVHDGGVYVNGARIDEPYLFKGADGVAQATEPLGDLSEWTIPDGQLFGMGDHRQASNDSRAFGPIPVD
ncbi:MAG: signal peptidase I, partial [Chloroflexota bacterium]